MTPAPETNVLDSPDRICRLVHLGTEVGDTFSVLAECYANSGGMGGDSPLFSTCFLRLTYYYYILSVFQNKRRGKKSTTSGNMSEAPSPEWAELTALEHSRINPYQTWCHDICFGAGV